MKKLLLVHTTLALAVLSSCKSVSRGSRLDASGGSSLSPSAPHTYDLSPQREALRDTMSLPEMLTMQVDGAVREALIDQYLSYAQTFFGVDLKKNAHELALMADEEIGDTLLVSWPLFHIARGTFTSRLRNPGFIQSYGYVLPQKFDWASVTPNYIQQRAAEITAANPLDPAQMPEVRPKTNIRQGWPRDPSIPDDYLVKSTVLGEVFERLATNIKQNQSQPFSVRYNGKDFTDFTLFVDELLANGHSIRAELHHRVADFGGLHARNAEGRWVDVAAPVFFKTGLQDSRGREALLPGMHSELEFYIQSSSSTRGQPIDARVAFYHASSKMGFRCARCQLDASWTGESITARYQGQTAVQALKVSGYLTDLIRYVGINHYAMSATDAYGIVGVCNDSVAVVQHAVDQGTYNSYPLGLQKDAVVAELNQRLTGLTGAPAAIYRSILGSYNTIVPDDANPVDARRRALLSMPWPKGQEPFSSAMEARSVLTSP